MKKILQIFIPLIIIGIAVYHFRIPLGERLAVLEQNVIARLHTSAPCAEPLPYTLGSFDTRFNISKEYFLGALSEAEAVWEKPYGKNLFNYSPENKSTRTLAISLIYDYRQEATKKLASLGIVVKDNRASYDMLKSRFDSLKLRYDIAKKDFNASVSLFKAKQQAYEAEVSSWNAKGGAPKDEYAKLESERLALNQEANIRQSALNNMTDELNALVVALNRLVSILNLSVDKYNTTSVSRGESFEEGVYYVNGIEKGIDIYEFSNKAKLVRVLAHELGHALGLDHIDDPKAIMYKLNQGNNIAVTAADLQELKKKCGEK